MWLLMIVLLYQPGKEYVLNDFKTEAKCIEERNRIGYDMAEAYPWDRDFEIVCRFQARVV